MKVLKLDMLLNYRFYIIFLLLFIIFPLKNTYSKNFVVEDLIDPYCNGIGPDEFLQEGKIDNIEIITDKTKKWTRNILGAIVEFNSEDSKTDNTNFFNFIIDKKYKKNFSSTVIVNFKKKNLSCKFRAKIRMTGDREWHIDWDQGNPLASVYVQLVDGHINSITRFKLYLPKSRGRMLLPSESPSESRGGDNEVFITSFLRELGFLAPRTFMVSSKINGLTRNYIFQEDLRKEFLEHFQLKEGPILEGDERFTIMKKKPEDRMPGLSLSRLANKNFSLKSETNRRIALTAVSNLNLIYLQHHQIENPSESYALAPGIMQINTEKFFLNKLNKEKFQIYESLISALGAVHGQETDDRRFYFDPINKYYVPIYYDGKADIVNAHDIRLQNSSFNISNDEKIGAAKAIKLINKIDHDSFVKKLVDSGMNISVKDYEKLIEKIIINLKIISKSKSIKVKFLKTKKYFSELEPNITKDKKLIFVDFEKKEFYLCSFDLAKCNIKKNDDLEFRNLLADILSQRYRNLEKTSLTDVEYLFVYDDIEYEKEKNLTYKKWKFAKIDEESFLKHNKDIKIDIFPERKKINIEQLSNFGRVIITGKKIDGWTIVFNGYQGMLDPNIPKDYLSLTGCLTLLDIQINDLSIFSKNSTCEDSINFIRTVGNVNTINVLESASDAIDLDFSNIRINLVDIKSAKNDCLDLSYGNYVIDKIIAENCGDKAISIGEKSIAMLKEININNSNIAVAVKDSSVANIDYSEIYNSPICFSAYRKKQEFSGGKIKISKTNCKKEQIFTQQGSKIILNL